MSKFTKMVDVPTVDVLAKIFGNLDENVKLIDKAFEVEVSNRDRKSTRLNSSHAT